MKNSVYKTEGMLATIPSIFKQFSGSLQQAAFY